jgi:GNAT superfamily N-acetyltransferase
MLQGAVMSDTPAMQGGVARTVDIRRVQGDELATWLPALAQLRIEVFRDFPYLYDGTHAYEAEYLRRYAEQPGSVLVIALAEDEVVGASTGMPMANETEAFRAPVQAFGLDPAKVFYFGESVLQREWRGSGIGWRFFDEREAHAAASGDFTHLCFCTVDRPVDHPLRPIDYRPLDSLWNKRDYHRQPALTTHYAWKDIDQPEPTDKSMTFWLRALS